MLHNARKDDLMKNKNKLAFLSVAFAALLTLGACNMLTPSARNKSKEESSLIDDTSEQSSDVSSASSSVDDSSSDSSSSSSSSSSSEENHTYTVTFFVGSEAVQTSQVDEGELAEYSGPLPTSTNGVFIGWSPDINRPITSNTEFHAVFEQYANTQMIDDFESYEDSPSMKDEGWTALTYSNGSWTSETAATVSLCGNAYEGNKALRFDVWANGVDYKCAKLFQGGEFQNAANALQFSLMIPSNFTVKVLLHAKMTIQGSVQSPSFTYTVYKESSDYVEYTIPLNDPGWALWGESGKSISWAADWLGVHEDALLNYLTRIEFYVKANGGGSKAVAYLDNVKFVTIDNPAYAAKERLQLADCYTASLHGGSTLRLDVKDNGTATASIIDIPSPVSVDGTFALNGNEVTFTSSSLTYKGTLTNGGSLIRYVSATGSLAEEVTGINLMGVQVLDNYEQYDKDGQAYYQNGDKAQRSGCRGAYYSEYYAGSGSSPWGGNGWMLMGGNGDQLKLKQDAAGAHSGNNYLCLKHSKDKAMRYMQWGLFDGSSEKNAYRGSTFSFWAKSNGWVQSFKFYAYSQSAPTNATKDEYVKAYQFTEQAAISEWKHYEIELNPDAVYYGFMVLIEKNYNLSANEAYLYIDDVEIYGANPYATYVEPEPEPPFSFKPNLQYNAKINGLIQAFLIPGNDNNISLSAPGLGLSVGGTYVVNEKEVTISLDGGVTYVLTASDDGYDLTFKSVTGSGIVADALNNLSFSMLLYGDNAESYEESGSMYYQSNTNEKDISGARGAYYCDYYTGSGTSPLGGSGWSLMGGSGDQLSLDKENYYEGKQSLKMKKSTAGPMRYLQWDLFKGTARPITGVNKFVVYLRNQAASITDGKLYIYTAQKITSSNQTTARVTIEITLEANQDWTAYEVELDPTQTYYGYGVYLAKASETGYINVDGAMFYGPDNDPTLNFYTKKDVILTGSTAVGEGNIKFDINGNLYLTLEPVGASNTPCPYTMSMNENHQIMTIKYNNNILAGEYNVSSAGFVTFTITSATGIFALHNLEGVVFSN